MLIKMDKLKGIEDFAKTRGTGAEKIANGADSMSDEVLIRTIRGFADNRRFSKANELAWQLYQIAKPLF